MRNGKSFILLVLVISLMLTLVACGGGDENNKDEVVKSDDNVEKVIEEDDGFHEEDNKNNGEDDDNFIDLDIGELEIIHDEYDLDINKESGPIKLKLDDILIGEFTPYEEYEDLYDEEITMLFLYIEVENTVDETVTIHPAQGSLVTNTKEQVEADLIESDDVGGDFLGKVVKEGGVVFFLDSDAEEIEDFKYVVSSAHGDGFKGEREDIVIEYKLDK